MNKHVLKRYPAHFVNAGKNHAGYPEENYIVAGYQYVCGEKVFQFRRFIRPAQRRKRPERGRKPGIQYVLILLKASTAALFAGVRRMLGHSHMPAVLAVIGRYTVSPPELTRNTPVLYIFHPIKICLFKALWNKFNLSLLNRLYSGMRQRLHIYEPLHGKHWLNYRLAAVAMSHVMNIILNLNQLAALFKALNQLFTAFKAIQALIFPGILIHDARFIHDLDNLQSMSAAHLEIVWVMRRGNLNHARAKFLFHILVRNYRNFTAQNRQYGHSSHKLRIPFVLGIDR